MVGILFLLFFDVISACNIIFIDVIISVLCTIDLLHSLGLSLQQSTFFFYP